MNGLRPLKTQNFMYEAKFSAVRAVTSFAYLAAAADALESPLSLTAKFVDLRIQASDNFH